MKSTRRMLSIFLITVFTAFTMLGSTSTMAITSGSNLKKEKDTKTIKEKVAVAKVMLAKAASVQDKARTALATAKKKETVAFELIKQYEGKEEGFNTQEARKVKIKLLAAGKEYAAKASAARLAAAHSLSLAVAANKAASRASSAANNITAGITPAVRETRLKAADKAIKAATTSYAKALAAEVAATKLVAVAASYKRAADKLAIVAKEIVLKEKAENITGLYYGVDTADKPLAVLVTKNVLTNKATVENVDFAKDLYIKANDVTLNNIKVVGTIFIDPGKDGTSTLNHVIAGHIKVLSGGEHSIHFNLTTAGTLEISTDQGTTVDNGTVRIVADPSTTIGSTTITSYAVVDSTGHMGSIEITQGTNGAPPTVNLIGTFTDPIIVNTSATITTTDVDKTHPTQVASLEVATQNNGSVNLEGNFSNVQVTQPSVLNLSKDSTIKGTLSILTSASINTEPSASIANLNVAAANPTDTVSVAGNIGAIQITNPANMTIGAHSKIETISSKVSTSITVDPTAVVRQVENGSASQKNNSSTISFESPASTPVVTLGPAPTPVPTTSSVATAEPTPTSIPSSVATAEPTPTPISTPVATAEPTSTPVPTPTPVASISNVTISGAVGNEITPIDVTIALTNCSFRLLPSYLTVVSNWVRNLPPGLVALMGDQQGNTVKIQISGTPTQPFTAPISIAIPTQYLTSGVDLTAVSNANAKFSITVPSASIGDVTVSGIVGTETAPVDVTIALTDSSFKLLPFYLTVVSNWVNNLPPGLVALMGDQQENTVKIQISGTPTQPFTAPISIAIPAQYLTTGVELTTATNANAKFAVSDTAALKAAITAEIGTSHQNPVYVRTQTDYTPTSWTTYAAALTAAIAVEGDPARTQAQVDSAMAALGSGKSGLVFAGQAGLDAAKQSATQQIVSYYTPSSWLILTNTLAMTETTNTEMMAKTTAINSALTGLIKEISSFTNTMIGLMTDEHLADLPALIASGKLPTTVTLTNGATSVAANITGWTGSFSGTVLGVYQLFPVWTMPAGCGDEIAPIRAYMSVMVTVAQTPETVVIGDLTGGDINMLNATTDRTYTVTTSNISDGKVATITWYADAIKTSAATAPTGISIIPAANLLNNSLVLNVSTTTQIVAGSYYFTVTIDGIESVVKNLTIGSGVSIINDPIVIVPIPNAPLLVNVTVAKDPSSAANTQITMPALPAGATKFYYMCSADSNVVPTPSRGSTWTYPENLLTPGQANYVPATNGQNIGIAAVDNSNGVVQYVNVQAVAGTTIIVVIVGADGLSGVTVDYDRSFYPDIDRICYNKTDVKMPVLPSGATAFLYQITGGPIATPEPMADWSAYSSSRLTPSSDNFLTVNNGQNIAIAAVDANNKVLQFVNVTAVAADRPLYAEITIEYNGPIYLNGTLVPLGTDLSAYFDVTVFGTTDKSSCAYVHPLHAIYDRRGADVNYYEYYINFHFYGPSMSGDTLTQNTLFKDSSGNTIPGVNYTFYGP